MFKNSKIKISFRCCLICSIIGAIFIVMGLYLVVWGKAKDHINKLTNQKSNAATELPITNEPETTAAERCSSKAPPA